MGRNILIAYYSHSANTRRIAELIQRRTGGTLCEIQPETPYPAAYNEVVELARKEIRAGFHPPLKSQPENLGACDTVFVGTPNWWSTMAPPVATFLAENDLSGKIVLPFCTHGGGGGGSIQKDVAGMCPNSTMTAGLVLQGNGGGQAEAQIAAWLDKTDIGKE